MFWCCCSDRPSSSPRQAADVDLLSGGRLRLGVGLGYNAVEYHALGAPWQTRGRRMSEQIPYLRRLWAGEPVTFTGEFDQSIALR